MNEDYTDYRHTADQHGKGYENVYGESSTQLTPAQPVPPPPPQKPTKTKLTKKEKKEIRTRQSLNEERLVKEGVIAPRYRYVPRNGFARIVSVCLAFLIGIFTSFGLLIWALHETTTQKMKDVAQFMGFDYSSVFTEAAAELSALDLLTEIIERYQNGEMDDLQSYAQYTPLVTQVADYLCEQLADLGVNLNKEEFLTVKLGDMGDFFRDDVLMNAVLADVLKIDKEDENADPLVRALCFRTDEHGNEVKTTVRDLSTDARGIFESIPLAEVFGIAEDDENVLVRAICYKNDGSKTNIGEIMNGGSGFLDDVALADVLDVAEDDEDAVLRAVCYKTDGNGAKRKVTLGDLKDGDTGVLDDIEVEALLGVDGNKDAALRYLAYGSQTELTDGEEVARYTVGEDGAVTMIEPHRKRTVGDLTAEDAEIIGDAKIGDLVNVDGNSSKLLRAIRYWTITELSDKDRIDRLTVGEVFEGEATDGLLKAVWDWSLSDLEDNDKIDSLKIGEVLNIGEDATGLNAAIRDWTFKELKTQSRIERLKIGQILVSTGDSKLIAAISDWRVSDITSQKKFNTLTLGDLLEIDGSSAMILQSLKDARLGELSDSVETLRFSQILSEEELNGNNILKNLKNSTLLSLAQDVKSLTVEQVFGDEIYSYLSVSENGGKTYAELVKAYETNRAESLAASALVPHPVTIGEGETVVVEYTYRGSAAQHGYFLNGSPVNGAVSFGTRKITVNGKTTTETYPYLETKICLTPVYHFSMFDYADPDTLKPLRGEITEENGSYVYQESGAEYPVLLDGYGYYYTDGETRIDLEREITGYTADGETYGIDGEGNVLAGGTAYRVYENGGEYYILTREEVTGTYYCYEGGSLVFVAESELTAHYYLSSDTSRTHELDRFLDGIWYLLLGGEEIVDGELVILNDADMNVLDVGGKITKTAKLVNDTPLWSLYFHGIIAQNPYRELPAVYVKDGETYNNLNEFTVTGIINYVQDILDDPSLLG